ncbi:MAG: glycosyltransferase [Candidatus Competibacteraceae bacterium]
MEPGHSSVPVIASFPNPFPGNPYLALLYTHLERESVKYQYSGHFGQEWLRANRGKITFLHFHWIGEYYADSNGNPSILRMLIFVAKIWLARSLGYQIIWTMHNLYPHDRKSTFKEWFCRLLFIQSVNLIFINFPGARDDLRRLFRRTRNIFVVPHGNYRPIYLDIPDREIARRALGLSDEDYIFFLFGGIRPYKGVHKAIAALAQLTDERITLIVMGQCLDQKYQSQLITLAENDKRVKLMLSKEDIPDDLMNLWMAAVDCVLAPYENIYTSGTLYLAATFGKPIISPRKGIFIELDDVPFVITYDPEADTSTLATKLSEVKQADLDKIQQSARQFADAHEWSDIAKHISKILYSHLH